MAHLTKTHRLGGSMSNSYTIFDRAGNSYFARDLSLESLRDLEHAVVNQPADFILKVSFGGRLDRRVLTIRATDIISITEHLG